MTARVLARAAFASVLAAGAFPGLAHAETIIALTNDNRLLTFDSATPGTASAPFAVTGLQNNEALLDIDIRPADLQLYAVSNQGRVYRVNTTTGVATLVSTLSADAGDATSPFTSLNSDTRFGIDFNPAADRLRVMAGTTNLRVNPDTGEVTKDGDLAFEDGDMHAGDAPAIVAAAYTNSHGKPEATAMYDIDATIVALIRQTAPNDGTLAAVGKLGIDAPGEAYAFDIQTTAEMQNTAWLVNGGMVYWIDLETGAAMDGAPIEGLTEEVRDVAVLPPM